MLERPEEVATIIREFLAENTHPAATSRSEQAARA